MTTPAAVARIAGRAVKTTAGIAFGIAIPTWGLAVVLKWSLGAHRRAATITLLNGFYLLVAVLSASYVWRFHDRLSDMQLDDWRSPLLLWAWFLWSRCAEIFYAFYRDVFDRLAGDDALSRLSWSRRVRLALNSYVELILNFSFLFALAPAGWWRRDYPPSAYTDALAYSASTITTSGGLGFTPSHPALQLLSTFEVFCGLVLLVVSFTVYVGRGLAELPTARRQERDVGDAVPGTTPEG